jgi:polygalacturonase
MEFSKVLLAVLFAVFTAGAAFYAPAQSPPLPVIPSATFNVTQYGAVGDGMTLTTAAVQKAIDACSAAGGGTVLVPAGTYLIGPITLASSIDLHIDAGATLLVIDDIVPYPMDQKGHCLSAIRFIGGHDIRVSGSGTIDGQGQKWWDAFRSNPKSNPKMSRPNLVQFSRVTRLEVSGITLQNSPGVHLVTHDDTDVTIRGVTFHSPSDSPNTDGINPSGWNYLITDCTIDVGDDNIAIKPIGTRTPMNKNFTITHCRFLHGHGMTMGWGTDGGIEDVIVSDSTFDSTQQGLRIAASRGHGGLIQNITYSDLRMTNVKCPIFFIDYYPYKTAPKHPSTETYQPVDARTPFNNNITIRNVTATDCPTAGIIYGLPEAPISHITFDHVNISAKIGLVINQAQNVRFISSKITVEQGRTLLLYKAQISGLE